MQELLILYGQLNVAKIALAAAHTRADIQANRDDLAKRIETIEESTRKLCADLSKELGL
jgi:hypothetical protein